MFAPKEDYSILHIKLAFIRLVYQMCVNGNIKLTKKRSKNIPFKKDIEIDRARTEWKNYLKEGKAA